MFQLATKPQSVWQVMADSLKLYRKSFLRLVFWAIVLAAVYFVAFLYGMEATKTGLVLQLVISLLVIVPTNAIMFDIYQTMHSQPVNIQSALIVALRRWFFVLLAMIIVCILMFVVGLVFGFVGTFAGVLLGDFGKFVFAIVGGSAMIYLMVNFLPYFPLIVTEKLGPIAALGKSFRIVKNSWWHTFALWVLTILVIFVINLIVALIFGGFHTLMVTPTAGTTSLSMGWIMANVIITVFFMPWLYGIFLLQINNLELRAKNHAEIKQVLDQN